MAEVSDTRCWSALGSVQTVKQYVQLTQKGDLMMKVKLLIKHKAGILDQNSQHSYRNSRQQAFVCRKHSLISFQQSRGSYIYPWLSRGKTLEGYLQLLGDCSQLTNNQPTFQFQPIFQSPHSSIKITFPKGKRNKIKRSYITDPLFSNAADQKIKHARFIWSGVKT